MCTLFYFRLLNPEEEECCFYTRISFLLNMMIRKTVIIDSNNCLYNSINFIFYVVLNMPLLYVVCMHNIVLQTEFHIFVPFLYSL